MSILTVCACILNILIGECTWQYQTFELLGKDPDRFIHPDYHAEHLKNMKKLMSGETVLTESVHIRKDGSSFPVEIHARGVVYDDEMCIVAVVRDTTKRKKVEESLREAKLRYRTLLEDISVDEIREEE